MERVLVTGAASWVGGQVVRNLEVQPGTEVLAVDDADPAVPFATELVRISLDRLEFAEMVGDFSPTAVLHLGTVDRAAVVGAEQSDSGLVIGAQALFGAIGRCADTKTVVVKSDSGVYGTGPRHPSVATERSPTSDKGTTRRQRRLRDMESFVAAQAEQHTAAVYSVLRLAPIVGSEVSNNLSKYLTLPVVPTQFGYDPRLQFIHEDDAVRALLHVVADPVPGIFNLAAAGQLYLSRILRLGRRVQNPMPRRGFKAVRRGLGAWDIHLTEADVRLLKYGRVMDTKKASAEFGIEPLLNCRQTVLALYQRLPEKQPSG